MPRKKEDPKKTPDPARQPFAVGTRVRVRTGTKDPDYPDIPLGGWTGTVVEMGEGDDGRTYHVEWDADAVRQMHPVYRRRCERDGLEIETAWLDEADLELNIGGPVEIEQPTRFRPRPLDPGEQDDRVRAVFDLTSDDPLPPPNRERLTRYHHYFNERLGFPLNAIYATMTSSFAPVTEEPVQFVGLAPLEHVREENGLLAEIESSAGERRTVELFDVETPNNPYVRQLIGDYSYWFCEAFKYALVEGGRKEIHLGGQELSPVNWPLAPLLVRCGLYGALSGSVVGAITASLDWALMGLVVAAAIFAFLGYFLGNALGLVLRALQLGQRGPRLGSVFGAIAGGLVGAVVGPLLIAFPGTVLGCIAGFIIGKTLVKCGLRRPGWLLGSVLGAGLGGVALACLKDLSNATIGLLCGAGVGAVLGIGLMLAFLVSLALFENPANEGK